MSASADPFLQTEPTQSHDPFLSESAGHPSTHAQAPRPDRSFVSPPHSNLFNLLDWQRATVAEARFHKHSSDANMKALRAHLGVEPFYEQQGHITGNAAIDNFLTHLGRGTIDSVIETTEDPLTYETFGVGPLARVLVRSIGSPLARIASRAVPEVAKSAASAVRQPISEIARAARDAYTDLFTAAGPARRAVGAAPTREALALESRQAAQEAELFRRLQELDEQAMRGLSDGEKSKVQQALNGDIPLASLTASERAAANARKNLTRTLFVMRAKPGSGAVAAASRWGTGARGPIARIVARARPKASEQELERAMQQEAAHAEMLGGPMTATPETMQSLLDLAAQLRAEAPTRYRTDANGELLRDLDGIPIEREPQFSRGAFGKLVRNVRPKKTLTLVAKGEMHPPEISASVREFASAPGTLTPKNLRRNYFPAKHYADEVSKSQPEQTFNLLEGFNPHDLSREDVEISPGQVHQFEDAFRGMLKSQARTITTQELAANLKRLFPNGIPPEIKEIYERKIPATGAERGHFQILAEAWKALINLPRAGIVGTSPRHMVNVLDLLVNAAPEAVPEAVARFAQLSTTRAPQRRWELLREATDMGLTAPHPDRGGPLSRLLPFNKPTWDFDTTAAWALARQLLAKGEARSALDAGQKAREMLVDYRHLSPATKAAQYVMPFATFGTQIPAATLRGVLRNPVRSAAVGRLFPPLYGSRTDDQGDARPLAFYGPTSEVGALDVPAFLRQRLSDEAKAALTGAGVSAHGKTNYFTYGQPLDWRLPLDTLVAPIPYARDVLNSIGAGPFKPESIGQTLLRTSTGFVTQESPQREAFEMRIDELRKNGNTAAADRLADAMNAWFSGDTSAYTNAMKAYQAALVAHSSAAPIDPFLRP